MKFKKIFICLSLILILASFSFPTISFANEISIDSYAGILIEDSTGKILYEKNSTEILFPASLTKIMTAILVLENCNLDDFTTITESAVSFIPDGYVTADIFVGEQLAIKDLLYVLMLHSANDIANVLAEHVSGNVEAFAELMNSKAIEIGCTNTHFVNPNGIHENYHYSTVYDMALITMYANKIPEYRKIISTESYTLPSSNLYDRADRTYKNTNSLIHSDNNYFYEYCIGGKTGFTSQAGRCLASTSLRDGLEFTCIIFNADTSHIRAMDTINLFNYGFDTFSLNSIKEKNNLITTIEIPNATPETKDLNILIDNNITALMNKNVNYSNLEPEINLDENIFAPIHKGEVLGSITYNIENIEYKANLIAGNDVHIYTIDLSPYIAITTIILSIFICIPFITKKLKKRKYN